MTQWIPYDVNKSPVQASLAVATALEAQNVRIIKMHQGAEESVPKAFSHLREYKGSFSPLYNNVLPGRKETAQFVRTFFGLPADENNTFLEQNNGRNPLARAARMSTRPFIKAKLEPAAITQQKRWPMYDDVMIDANVEHQIMYDLKRNGLVNDIAFKTGKFLGEEGKNRGLAIFVSNLPANPTGYASSPEEMKNIESLLAAFNEYNAEKGLPKIVHIADDPYFGGLEQKDTGSVFKTPYEGNFKMDGITPSVHVISFSKALGTARPGMTATVFTSSKMAKDYETAIKAGNAFSYDPAAMAAFTQMISEENYPALREHFQTALRDKYIRNFGHVQKHLGAQLVDGDPNMVCTIRIPPEALGQSIRCHDGERRTISNGREMAEYIANTYGAITVDQSLPGEPMLRLALKLEDSGQIEEGVYKIAQAFDDLRNAPALNRGVVAEAPDLGL
jgi:aspartate/methionine/tyrosine aminotransferase